MRRRHDHIDAVIHHEAAVWRLQFLLNDQPLVTWHYADREDASTEATGRLRELQRAGWTVHW